MAGRILQTPNFPEPLCRVGETYLDVAYMLHSFPNFISMLCLFKLLLISISFLIINKISAQYYQYYTSLILLVESNVDENETHCKTVLVNTSRLRRVRHILMSTSHNF